MNSDLTAPKRKRRRRKKKKTKAPNRLRLALRAGAIGAFSLFFGTLVWAGFYTVAAPPGTLLMLQRKLSGDVIHHPWTRLEDISPNLVTAVIAAEDTRFCLHHGIDRTAIDKALTEAKNGKKLRGASTISQQTAKNAFFWNGGGWLRKGGEAWMTVVIEAIWPKRRIMEVYLNIAEWGDGHFGAEAAAQARFGKSAKHLTAQEAALLASVLPNPHKWRVDPPGPYVRQRAGTVRSRMNQVRRDGLDACVLKSK
ncbi:monofunctional biosynthetic peptidoglycan transglycosylase [Hyphococcus sp.]|uniref:monofunctional biosynthetic peptidoglycan transglycosylase n=1 Tax=Hyphococcus sp. TaxID=2038636 RepID=UPI0020873636|nr:MAG: monofunctional biosynthetic peptidoglycan transglycosylase [Marinicaulis sp.]